MPSKRSAKPGSSTWTAAVGAQPLDVDPHVIGIGTGHARRVVVLRRLRIALARGVQAIESVGVGERRGLVLAELDDHLSLRDSASITSATICS